MTTFCWLPPLNSPMACSFDEQDTCKRLQKTFVVSGSARVFIQPAALDRPGQARLRYGLATELWSRSGWRPQYPLESTLDAIYDDWLLRLSKRRH
mgnify:CR=1 FL=1